MNLVQRLELNTNRQRRLWVESMRDLWIEEGEEFKEWRISLGISISRAARSVGVGTDKLRKFEAGDPVKNAKSIRRMYDLYLDNETLKAQLDDLRLRLD